MFSYLRHFYFKRNTMVYNKTAFPPQMRKVALREMRFY